MPSLVAGVGWDSLASIAAYHGAQATWPPLLTPSSSSSSIPQLPPPKLNNAHQHILLQQRYVAGCFEKPIYWSNEVLYVALLDVTNIWRLLCALWQGGGGTRQHHTAQHFAHTLTHSTTSIYERNEKISDHTIIQRSLMLFVGFVDCLEDQMDDTAKVGYGLFILALKISSNSSIGTSQR